MGFETAALKYFLTSQKYSLPKILLGILPKILLNILPKEYSLPKILLNILLFKLAAFKRTLIVWQITFSLPRVLVSSDGDDNEVGASDRSRPSVLKRVCTVIIMLCDLVRVAAPTPAPAALVVPVAARRMDGGGSSGRLEQKGRTSGGGGIGVEMRRLGWG
jgi:hypothetical protein